MQKIIFVFLLQFVFISQVFSVEKPLVKTTPPLVVLIFPVLNSQMKEDLLTESEDWINHRKKEGYDFEIICFYEIYGKTSITYDEANELETEDIRLYLQKKYLDEIKSDPSRKRYLGLVSDRPKYYSYDNHKNIHRENDFLKISDQFTMEFLLMPYHSSSYYQVIVNTDEFFTIVKLNENTIRITYNIISGNDDPSYSDIILLNPNDWNHFAITFDQYSHTSKVFLNGNLQFEKENVKKIDYKYQEFSLGGTDDFYSDYSGKIDDFKVSKGILYNENFSKLNELNVDENTIVMWDFEEIIQKEDQLLYYNDISENRYDINVNETNISNVDGSDDNYLDLYPILEEEYSQNTYPEIQNYYLLSDKQGLTRTDAPFGFISYNKSIVFGKTEEKELDYNLKDFIVFRIPIREKGDLNNYLNKSLNFEASSYKKDLTLVAGRYEKDGDTSLVQCENAHKTRSSNQIFKVFDYNYCNPYLSTGESSNLFQFMQLNENYFGGVILNISHGDNKSIVFNYESKSFDNLNTDQIPQLDENKLNVFISLACANDSDVLGSENLARMLYFKTSPVVISGSKILNLQTFGDLYFGELKYLDLIFDQGETLGNAYEKLLIDYYNYNQNPKIKLNNNSYLSNLFALNFYGDPLIRLHKLINN